MSQEETHRSLLDGLHKNDVEKLHELVSTLPPADAARAVSRLSTEEQTDLLTVLAPEDLRARSFFARNFDPYVSL